MILSSGQIIRNHLYTKLPFLIFSMNLFHENEQTKEPPAGYQIPRAALSFLHSKCRNEVIWQPLLCGHAAARIKISVSVIRIRLKKRSHINEAVTTSRSQFNPCPRERAASSKPTLATACSRFNPRPYKRGDGRALPRAKRH